MENEMNTNQVSELSEEVMEEVSGGCELSVTENLCYGETAILSSTVAKTITEACTCGQVGVIGNVANGNAPTAEHVFQRFLHNIFRRK